jgi:glutamate synthase (NADPH/NADH) large chain
VPSRQSLDKICAQAEEAVRSGYAHLILTDERVGPTVAAIPMILATGAVHSHLVRTQLRTFTSLNVRSAECVDTHYFAVLIGVGATTVNAWLAQECIADRHARGLFGSRRLGECVKSYMDSVSAGLLKIISKMGISVISSYRGGYNFEAVGSVPLHGGRVLPGYAIPNFGHRPGRHPEAHLQAACKGVHEDVAALPIGGLYRYRTRRRNTRAFGRIHSPAAISRDAGKPLDLPQVHGHNSQVTADKPASPDGLQAAGQDADTCSKMSSRSRRYRSAS